MVCQVSIRHQHFELGIKAQKRLEQILLGPKTQFIYSPVLPIIKGQKNIVNMHDHAWLKTRQHVQEKIIHVSTNFHGMRTVDEQNIARIELREKFQADVFFLFLYQGMKSAKSLPEEIKRKRLNTDQRRVFIFCNGLGC